MEIVIRTHSVKVIELPCLLHSHVALFRQGSPKRDPPTSSAMFWLQIWLHLARAATGLGGKKQAVSEQFYESIFPSGPLSGLCT